LLKLKLDVDTLAVQSFETGDLDEARGTVRALGGTIANPNDTVNACDPPLTYQAGSCNGGVCTNDYSCQESWANGCTSDPMTGWTDPAYC
jgi:hypothetical protein